MTDQAIRELERRWAESRGEREGRALLAGLARGGQPLSHALACELILALPDPAPGPRRDQLTGSLGLYLTGRLHAQFGAWVSVLSDPTPLESCRCCRYRGRTGERCPVCGWIEDGERRLSDRSPKNDTSLQEAQRRFADGALGPDPEGRLKYPRQPVRTNRDLYLRVTSLPKTTRSLEDYLRALLRISLGFGEQPPSIDEIALVLEHALSVEPLRELEPPPAHEGENCRAAWIALLQRQVGDLRRMAESGDLENEYRYYGIDAPGGGRWYNFDPLGYLECGVRGIFGGYAEGEVIVLAQPAPGETADSAVEELLPPEWEDLLFFLRAGQAYE